LVIDLLGGPLTYGLGKTYERIQVMDELFAVHGPVLNDDEVPFDADVNYRVPLGREACKPPWVFRTPHMKLAESVVDEAFFRIIMIR
jgi:hypothetical protein